jgi:hypothetical protein
MNLNDFNMEAVRYLKLGLLFVLLIPVIYHMGIPKFHVETWEYCAMMNVWKSWSFC